MAKKKARSNRTVSDPRIPTIRRIPGNLEGWNLDSTPPNPTQSYRAGKRILDFAGEVDSLADFLAEWKFYRSAKFLKSSRRNQFEVVDTQGKPTSLEICQAMLGTLVRVAAWAVRESQQCKIRRDLRTRLQATLGVVHENLETAAELLTLTPITQFRRGAECNLAHCAIRVPTIRVLCDELRFVGIGLMETKSANGKNNGSRTDEPTQADLQICKIVLEDKFATTRTPKVELFREAVRATGHRASHKRLGLALQMLLKERK